MNQSRTGDVDTAQYPQGREIQNGRFLNLAFNESSPGTPIILVHGLLCSIYFWYPPHLEVFDGHPIYSISLPGHYPAEPVPAQTTLTGDYLVDTIFEQIDGLIGDQPCILVGHSTGGLVALLAAARRPEQIQGVIAMGAALSGKEEGGIYGLFQWMATRLGRPGQWFIAQTLKISALSQGVHRLFMRDVVAEPRRFLRHPELPAWLDYYFPTMQKLSTRSVGVYFRDLGDLDISEPVSTIRCPALVMSGSRDPYVTTPRAEALAAGIPDSKLAMVDGSGHLPMFEQWTAYAAAIHRFLSKALP